MQLHRLCCHSLCTISTFFPPQSHHLLHLHRIAERPQAELAVLCARDIVTAVPDELIVAECTLKNLAAQPSPLRRAYNSVRRSILSRAKGPGDALLAMDENYYRWMVEDNFRFMKKPRHCTWELFYKELSSFSFFFELHPKKPEDSFILHILQHSADEAPKVIWSAEHAVWQGPVIPDMYAAMGTMMARRLKTRTLSFDNGRGTISELNFRHVSPHTSAVHINARPAYYYDAHMREKREENASWYFTKEMVCIKGQSRRVGVCVGKIVIAKVCGVCEPCALRSNAMCSSQIA